MTDDRTPPPDDDDVLAAEYALGLLGPGERRDAQARIGRDPVFSAAVHAWTERLAPLTEEAGEAAPSPRVWARIVDALDGPYRPANDNGQALRVWRRLALGASGLAAASIAAVLVLLARPPEPAAQVATLTTPAGATAAAVVFDEDTGALLVTPGPGLHAAGGTPHLWLVKPEGGVQLVGAIDPAKAATHNLPPALARSAEAASALALSLEPAGHRPVDRPGGPTVATGALVDL